MDRMNFDQEVMQYEIEKAERMLKKTDRLIKRVKAHKNDERFFKRPSVKFQLPEI